jgi:predicted DNA-binding protein (MmcQ/YjbR family)
MNSVESIRKLCLSFPRATEQVQWGYDLVFKIGGKMFAITPLEPARVFLTFKATDESFAELTERPNIIPAPYLARAKWVALENAGAVSPQELASLLRISYDLVLAKLPKKTRAWLAKSKPKSSKRKSSTRKSISLRRK